MAIKVSGWTDSANGGTMVETEILINEQSTGFDQVASSDLKLIVDENTYSTLAANTTQTIGSKIIINLPSSYETLPSADQALAISGNPVTANGITTINTHFVTVGGGGGGGGGTVTSVGVVSSNNNIAVSGSPITLDGDITLTSSLTPNYQSIGLTHGTGNSLKTITIKVNGGTDEELILPNGGTASIGKFLKVINVNNGVVTTEWATGDGTGTVTSVGVTGNNLVTNQVNSGAITSEGTIALADNITINSVILINNDDNTIKLQAEGILENDVIFNLSDEGIGTGKLLSAKNVTTDNGITTIETSWIAGDGSGTVTSIETGAGLTGGPITTTGTISLASAIDVNSIGLVHTNGNTTTHLNLLAGDDIATGSIALTNKNATTGKFLSVANNVNGEVTTHWVSGDGTGTVTSIEAGSNLTGGTITTTGTIGLADNIEIKTLKLNGNTHSVTLEAATSGMTDNTVIAFSDENAAQGKMLGIKTIATANGITTINTDWIGGDGSGTVTSIAAGNNLKTDQINGAAITGTGTISLDDEIKIAGIKLINTSDTENDGYVLLQTSQETGIFQEDFILTMPSNIDSIIENPTIENPYALAIIGKTGGSGSPVNLQLGFHDLNYIEDTLRIETPFTVEETTIYSFTEFVNKATILGPSTNAHGIKFNFPTTEQAEDAEIAGLNNVVLIANEIKYIAEIGIEHPAHFECTFDFKQAVINGENINTPELKLNFINDKQAQYSLALKTLDEIDGSITLTTVGATPGYSLHVASANNGAITTEWKAPSSGATVTSVITTNTGLSLINGSLSTTGNVHALGNSALTKTGLAAFYVGGPSGDLFVTREIKSTNTNITVTNGDGSSDITLNFSENPSFLIPTVKNAIHFQSVDNNKVKHAITTLLAPALDPDVDNNVTLTINLPIHGLSNPGIDRYFPLNAFYKNNNEVSLEFANEIDTGKINIYSTASGYSEYHVGLAFNNNTNPSLDGQAINTLFRLPSIKYDTLPIANSPLVALSSSGDSNSTTTILGFGAPSLVANGEKILNGIALGGENNNEIIYSEVLINADKEISNLKSIELIGGDENNKTMKIQHSATSSASNVVYVFPEGIPTVTDRLVVTAVNTVTDVTTITFGYETI